MTQEIQIPLFAQADLAQEPRFVSPEILVTFESEADAICYSVDQIVMDRRGLTHMGLAEEMKIDKSVMTRMRQGRCGIPVGKLRVFMETTLSFAVLQYHAFKNGLVLQKVETAKAKDDLIKQQAKRIDELEQDQRYRASGG